MSSFWCVIVLGVLFGCGSVLFACGSVVFFGRVFSMFVFFFLQFGVSLCFTLFFCVVLYCLHFGVSLF